MPRAIDTNSLGIMTIVIVFCSAPTSVIICMRRSSRPAGLCMMSRRPGAALGASSSASALMARARFSRSASASCAMARCIVSGISTFFICTRSTLTPQGSVALSVLVSNLMGDDVLLLEDVVERVLSDDAPQGRQRHLDDRVVDAGHLNDGTARIDDALPNDSVNLDRDVVARDRFLRFHGGGFGAQIQRHLPFDQWQKKVDTGTGRAVVLAEPEDDGALILIGNSQTRDRQQGREHKGRNHNGGCQWTAHGGPP